MLQRLFDTLVVLLGVTTLVFFLTALVPGDPVDVLLGESAAAADREAIRASMGLDRPLPERWWQYLTQVAQGDLGQSLVRSRPVAELIPVTAQPRLGRSQALGQHMQLDIEIPGLTQQFIAGEWTAPSNQNTVDVVSPATEEVLTRVANPTLADADAAAGAARLARAAAMARPIPVETRIPTWIRTQMRMRMRIRIRIRTGMRIQTLTATRTRTQMQTAIRTGICPAPQRPASVKTPCVCPRGWTRTAPMTWARHTAAW